MSCRTVYVVRSADGAVRFGAEKRGRYLLSGPEAVADLPLSELPGWYDDAYCQGAMVDFVDQRFRFYPCHGASEPLVELDRRARESIGWRGWDAGVAAGGRDEFGELLPSAAQHLRPHELPDLPATPPVSGHDRVWFTGWDERTREIAVRYGADSGLWYVDEPDLVTIVGEDGSAADYWLSYVDTYSVHPVLAWLRHGPAAVEALAGGVPFPAPDETAHTVVVDQQRRVIRFSLTALMPTRLLREVAAAWPGYELTPGSRADLAGRSLRWPRVTVVGRSGSRAAGA